MAINFPATPSTNQTYTFNGRTWTWNGVGWQATGSTGLTVYTKTDFTATAGQTSFSATYTVGFVDVYYNGSKLSTSEYTATTGSTVVLGTACAVGDIVETIAWTISSSFNPSLGSASATSLAIGGATIGTNALAVTGTAAISGAVTAPTFNSSTLAVSTRQVLTSGTTYTTPANVRQLRIRMVGGGGGGAGSSSSTRPSGSAGGASSFNSITAVGGAGGTSSGGFATTPGSGTASFRVIGNAGTTGAGNGVTSNGAAGGNGGGSVFGGGTPGPVNYTGAGTSALANSGAGGSSSVNSAGVIITGGGGQAGEYVELIINSPSATYTYAIGTGGAGGTGGTENGGNGGTGLIIVDEFY